MIDFLKGFFFFFFVLAIAIGFVFVLRVGLDRQDQADCYKWQAQAKEYPGFYLTKYQADQCRYWNIQVDAPVK